MSERNCYYAQQLVRTGREDLVAAVQRGEMTMHKALCIAGELPKLSPYDKLLRAWNRCNEDDRKRFLLAIDRDDAPWPYPGPA